MNSLEIREQRAALVSESRKLLEKAESEQRELSQEEENEWQRRMTDVDKLEAELKKQEKREKLEAVEGELRAIQPRKTSPTQPQATNRVLTKGDRNKALKAWMGYGSAVKGMNYDGDTFNRCADAGFGCSNNTVNLRSLNTASAGAGGNATFVSTYDQLQTELKYFSPIAGKINVIPTGDGNNFVLPRGTDVANLMAIVAQSGSSGTTTDPSFDKVTLGSYLFRYIELVTFEMLQDSVFDLESWLYARLAERAARTVEHYVVNGTGSSQPTGIVPAALAAIGGTATVTLASTHKNLYRFEDLFSLFAGVDLAYRKRATLLLHDNSVWDLRGIKDSDGRYLWDINNSLVQNAMPDKIAGFDYLVTNSIDAPGTFAKDIAAFVDLSRYTMRLVDSVQITRLNELYRATGMIGFEVMLRFDGNYIGHAGSCAVLATAAS